MANPYNPQFPDGYMPQFPEGEEGGGEEPPNYRESRASQRRRLRVLRMQRLLRAKIIADYDVLVSGLESLEGQNLYKDIEA